MKIIDTVLSFVISYISGSLPTLKDSLNQDFEQNLDDCYQKALKKWCKNNSIRNSLAAHKFRYLPELKTYLQDKNENIRKAIPRLVELWAEELRNDNKCYNFINEQKIEGAEHRLFVGINELNELEKDTNEKVTKLYMQSSGNVLGVTTFGPVKGYIPRYCALDEDASDISIHFGLKKRYTLADYLLGLADETNNKYILYSSAQVGKTTELKNLAWMLSESGLYMPYLYEVKKNRNLSMDHLPTDIEMNGKKVVVLIDALDEVNGNIHKNLLSVVDNYSTLHIEIPMVVSCRKNYRRDRILESFTPLFLQDITQDEISKYVENKLGNTGCFFHQVHDLGIDDMMMKPFFLKVLIDIYKEGSKLPNDAIDIYQKFIADSFSRERSKIDSFLPISEQEACARLQHMSVVMMLTGKQELYVDEVRLCLLHTDCLEECLRVDLLQQTGDENYTFINNAIKEYFVAKFLSEKSLEDVIHFVCFPKQKKRVKPEWYHVMLLWLAFVKKKGINKLQPILDWLKSSCMELMINVDHLLVDEATRNEVFKSILLEYKQLGIRFSNILADDYHNLMIFAQTDESIRFIASELETSQNNSAYQNDLYCLCIHVDWAMLSLKKDVFNVLFDAYIHTLKKDLQSGHINSLSLLVLKNTYFHTNEYAEFFYDLLKGSKHYDCIKALMNLFCKANVVDQHLDYILQKELYVHNVHEGNYIKMVNRETVYVTLSKVKNAGNICKVLEHNFKDCLLNYSTEGEKYVNMVTILLGKAAKFYKEGNVKIETTIRKAYLNIFGERYFCSNKHKENLLLSYRNFYEQTNCKDKLRNDFYQNTKPLFKAPTSNHRNNLIKGFALTALWLTKEELTKIITDLNPKSKHDELLGSWFVSCPWEEISEHAKILNDNFFDKKKEENQYLHKQQTDFNEMCLYPVFKNLVIEALDKKAPSNLKEFYNLDEDIHKRTNNFVLQFFREYAHKNNQYRLDEARKAINNKGEYDLFFMKQVAERLERSNVDGDISEELKNRAYETAREVLEAISNNKGSFSDLQIEVAIKLLLIGNFEVKEEVLLGLLDYGHIYAYGNNFDSDFTLFDYIREKVKISGLIDKVIIRMKQTVNDINYHEFASHASFVIDNHIDEGINLVFKRIIVPNNKDSIYLLNKLISIDCRLDTIYDLLNVLKEEDKRFYIMRMLCDKAAYKPRIREHLFPKWQQSNTLEKHKTLDILLRTGCIEALQYVIDNFDKLNTSEFVFSYDSIDAAPLLCKILKLLLKENSQTTFAIDHVVRCLENIAIENETALQKVTNHLEQLIAKDESLKSLNFYLLNIKEKFYSKHNHEMTVIEALAYINEPYKQNFVDINVEAALEENKAKAKVFISYNWEEASNAIVENLICSALEKKHINYVIDKKDCKFHMSIREFEERIGKGDKIIVVVCKNYFESENCMYEAANIVSCGNLKERMYVIHMGDLKRDPIKVYKPIFKKWSDLMNMMYKEVKEIGSPGNEPFVAKYEKYKKIHDNIGTFWEHFNDDNSKSLTEVTKDNCKELFRVMEL